MANVTSAFPGVFKQIQLVARLRWRILRNSLGRKSSRWDMIGVVLTGVISSVLVLGLCFAFYSGAKFSMARAQFGWITLLLWAIFLFWQIFPVFVAGFGANFEFKTLLRFPFSVSAFYIIGLAYGLSDFSAIASVLWLISVCLGAGISSPGAFPGLLVVALVFVLFNVTLERLIGSWLERIFARRRTRELFIGLFILCMVSLNFLNPAINRYGASIRPLALRLVPYFGWLPPSLAGRAIAGVAQLHPAQFLLGFLGVVTYLALLTAFLWNRYSAQYRGEELSETAAPLPVKAAAPTAYSHVSGTLSFLPPQVAAVARKEFRYLKRNGMMLVSLIVPPVMILFFASQFGAQRPSVHGRPLSSELFFPGMMAYLILILMAPSYNSFAYEGRGIQSYFLAPVRFREVFLGKNFVLVSILVLEVTLSLGVLVFINGAPSITMLAATATAFVFTVTGQLTIANWSSLKFPRRLEFGKMQGQRQSGMAVLVAFAAQIILGGISTVILFAGKWTNNPWLPAEAFVFLGIAAAGGYFASLDGLSQMAESKKETLLEALCR
jgi:hypothetical protein